MALFAKPTYDRNETLARAAKAESRRQHKKAIAEYRRLLEHEPDNTVVLGKLALLLAKTKQYEESLQKFAICAERYDKQGFQEKALAVYRQATGFIPREPQLWEQIAKISVKRGHAPDAIRALLDGRARLRRKSQRPAAIRLLRQVILIEPWHFQASLDLARTLIKDGASSEAWRILESICERKRGRELRIARAVMFRLSPTPAAAWRWLLAALRAR